MNKKKIIALKILLITIPVIKGEVQPPLSISELYQFLLGIVKFWVEHIEKLVGPIVGIV